MSKLKKILVIFFLLVPVFIIVVLLVQNREINKNISSNSFFTPEEFSISDSNKIEIVSETIKLIYGAGGYPTDNPYVTNTDNVQYTQIFGFVENLGANNEGIVKYQISNNGNDWYWWNTQWSLTTSGYSETNTATEINAHISTFHSEIGEGNFYYRAFLHASDSETQVELENVTIRYTSSYAPVISSISPGYASTNGNSLVKIFGSNFVVSQFGYGTDGSVTIAGNKNINQDSISPNRNCADAINYSVIGLTNSIATLATSPSPDCLTIGDEVLLTNLQGNTEYYQNVGNYETLAIAAINGDEITFATPKNNYYGNEDDDNNIGTGPTNQKVMLQRVPNYLNLTINSGIILSGDAWNGLKGGVMYLKVSGNFSNQGTISMQGKGYRGGITAPHPGSVDKRGGQGETINADNTTRDYLANLGGGGGGHPGQSGWYWWNGAGGGSHATNGTNGSNGAGNPNPFGLGATTTYGVADLKSKIFFGSGGGGSYGLGGDGGGIVILDLLNNTNIGSINANAEFVNDYNYAGGASGAGGSIKIKTNSIDLGSSLLTAQSMTPYYYGSADSVGGNGGVGRINIEYSESIAGSSSPAANTIFVNEGFDGTKVFLDNAEIQYSIISESEINIYPPVKSSGTYDIEIINPDNQRDILIDGIEYIAPVSITSVVPQEVPKEGGSLVTITGVSLMPNLLLKINDNIQSYTYVDTETIQFTAPASISGYADITITNEDGVSYEAINAIFFLANPPIINSINNNVGTISGGTEIEISGDNFQPGEFGDASDGDITIASSKNINTDIIAVDRT